MIEGFEDVLQDIVKDTYKRKRKCKAKLKFDSLGQHTVCSNCGLWDEEGFNIDLNYCPKCGKEIEKEK